jgi:hypothetical protein
MLFQANYVLLNETNYKNLISIFNKPVPSNVIASETEERPLIKTSTANGVRRPILQKFNPIILFTNIQNLLISNEKCNNK